jgi:hypothetical protein
MTTLLRHTKLRLSRHDLAESLWSQRYLLERVEQPRSSKARHRQPSGAGLERKGRLMLLIDSIRALSY